MLYSNDSGQFTSRLHTRHKCSGLSLKGIVWLSLLMICFTSGKAEAQRLKIAQEETVTLTPYFTFLAGVHDIQSDDYGQVFNNPLFRYGGGFGMRYGPTGFEVLVRGGSSENTVSINENRRVIYFSETDIQLRLYGIGRFQKILFPAGIGVGVVNMTVDRGFAGTYDRFSGRGLYVGPFIGIEYPVSKNLSLVADLEYSLVGEAEFSSNANWNNMYYQNIEDMNFPGDVPNFWDTVGADNNETLNSRGFFFTVKVVISIPTYKGKFDQ